jgi:hypothetical protein
MLTRFLRWALPLKRHNPNHLTAPRQQSRRCGRQAETTPDSAGTCRSMVPGAGHAPHASTVRSPSYRRHWSYRCRTHHIRRTIVRDVRNDWFTGSRGHD